MKLVRETQKIIGDSSIAVTATAIRIPVVGGHSEAVNVEFSTDYNLNELRALLAETPGVIVQDDTENYVYPMPLFAQGKDEVFVGRLRRDESRANALNMWIVADNLRKGAATNTIQIAEYLVENHLV
jgi:aspartate-semialdehyde dehydrogenase